MIQYLTWIFNSKFFHWQNLVYLSLEKKTIKKSLFNIMPNYNKNNSVLTLCQIITENNNSLFNIITKNNWLLYVNVSGNWNWNHIPRSKTRKHYTKLHYNLFYGIFYCNLHCCSGVALERVPTEWEAINILS